MEKTHLAGDAGGEGIATSLSQKRLLEVDGNQHSAARVHTLCDLQRARDSEVLISKWDVCSLYYTPSLKPRNLCGRVERLQESEVMGDSKETASSRHSRIKARVKAVSTRPAEHRQIKPRHGERDAYTVLCLAKKLWRAQE